jgi:DNA polymerase
MRGKPIHSEAAACIVATVHPSSILRAIDEETRHREFERFVADLKVAARIVLSAPSHSCR